MVTEWARAHSDETGSSLVLVLVMITILALMVGAVFAMRTAQHRFIQRDAHRLQARYLAEASIYIAMDSLQHNPIWRPKEAVLDLPMGQSGQVTVESFGGYLLIRSVAAYRNYRSTLQAVVGERTPEAFSHALYLWDADARLHVAGRTHIKGDIVVGPRGMRSSTFKRERYTGRMDGDVRLTADLTAPFFDTRLLEGEIDRLDAYLQMPLTEAPTLADTLSLAQHLPSENPIYHVAGSLHLSSADSLLLSQPITVVSDGDVTLEGPLYIQPRSQVVAGGQVRLRGEIAGYGGLFYGREGIEAADSARCEGQFLAGQQILLQPHTHLTYPSLLYVSMRSAPRGTSIIVEDNAIVEGLIIRPPFALEPTDTRGRILIAPTAIVRGALFNAHETEFHGTLYGTLLTHQFYFYDSPSSYVNWLKDATIDVEERPTPFLLPLQFSATPRLAVVRWEAFSE